MTNEMIVLVYLLTFLVVFSVALFFVEGVRSYKVRGLGTICPAILISTIAMAATVPLFIN